MAIRQLAGQTIWYGLSNVLSRLLSFLLTPIVTYLLDDSQGIADFGDFSLLYAWIGVANVLFTYGLETGYFRFSEKNRAFQLRLFNTTFGSHLITSFLLSVLIILFSQQISNFLLIGEFPEIIVITALILFFDTLSTIPFAKLRHEERPRKYAFVRIAGIFLFLFLVLFFLWIVPKYLSQSDNEFVSWVMNQSKVTLIVMSNAVQSVVVFLLLKREYRGFWLQLDKKLWQKIINYSAPMIIIGLAGMINEVMDRQMLQSFLPHSVFEKKQIVGIYSANYKIAIFITLFIQAFRLAAEPFFFKQRVEKNAPEVYAKVMKWFVITLCIAFLFTALFLNIWKYLIDENYWGALYIVPILLIANIFLGIYYNLSIWYKITDKMYWGVIITLTGAVITLAGNYWYIPKYEMLAAAVVTAICYGTMVVFAYFVGQRYYPIPYPIRSIFKYLLLMLVLYFCHSFFQDAIDQLDDPLQVFLFDIISGVILLLLFVFAVVWFEKVPIKKILSKLPIISRFF